MDLRTTIHIRSEKVSISGGKGGGPLDKDFTKLW